MIRIYHKYTLQTDPRHSQEEPQNNTVTRHQEDKQGKAISSLFPIKMAANQERTQSMEQSQNPHWEQQSTNDQHKQNHRPRTDSSPSHLTGEGGQMHSTGTKPSPQIPFSLADTFVTLLFFKHVHVIDFQKYNIGPQPLHPI